MTSVIPVMGDVMGVVMAGPFDARGIDPDVLLWRDAVATNGGTVSAARLAIVNTFVAAEKASGAWALTDDYWGFWAENAVQALTSLKQRRLATVVNSPTFTADRDYTFNGTTNYINTGFVPSTHAVAMTGTRLRIAVYERTNVGASTFAAGGFSGATSQLRINPRSAANRLILYANADFAQTGASITDSRGLTAAQRDSSTYTGYNNGLPIALSAPASEGSSLASQAIGIGCYIISNSGSGFRASSVGFACAGAPMSDAQNLAQYNSVQAFATAVGAQV